MTNEVETLLKQFAKTPNDEKVLTALAFYYLEHPDGDKDLAFFAQAYHAKPCIETIHNYAFWLQKEYDDCEKAIPLQQTVLAMNPQSYYPYLAYAQSLIAKNWNQPYSNELLTQLLELYQIVIDKIKALPQDIEFNQRFILTKVIHNMAKCYVFLGDIKNAEDFLLQTLSLYDLPLDVDDNVKAEEIYFVMLDLVKFYWFNQQPQKALNWLGKAAFSTQKDILDIADLYSHLGEYQRAYDTLQGDFNFDESWDWIVFALYQVNPKQWREYYEKRLVNAQDLLAYYQQELQTSQEKGDKANIENNQESLVEIAETIASFQNALATNQPITPKKLPLRNEFYFNHFGCLLFGCEMHHNLPSDNIC